ncbi:MAG: hypothetical protein GY744_00415 [Gammaproteobacteria bacterium]|nr:hypothetical protein [Gammaproteobacteria bacterium]
MISFQAPLWLLLLGLIPVIYWLHRFAQRSTTFYSSSLFLWLKIPSFKDHRGVLGKVDLRWLLRALISILLTLALAEASIQRSKTLPFEVWVDDSLSMFTQEGEFKRIQLAMQRLVDLLNQNSASKIQVHSLGNSALSIELNTADISSWEDQLTNWSSQPRGESSPPPVSSLAPDTYHILVTDGADLILNSWAQYAPINHILQVGKSTRNITLSHLSLRRSMDESGSISGITQIHNLSANPQKIEFNLQHQGDILQTQLINIPAYGKSIAPFNISSQQLTQLQARIVAVGDALTLDNSLHLEVNNPGQTLRYKIQSDCGPYLQAVLDSHPLLLKVERQPELIISCSSTQQQNSKIPTLIFHSSASITQSKQTAHWHNTTIMDSLKLPAGLTYSDKAPELNSTDTPILSADERVLISLQKRSSNTIHSYLDINNSNLTQQAEYPLIIFRLIRQLTQHSLDFTPLSVSRNIKASQIAPLPLPAISTSMEKHQATFISITSFLIFSALLLLLLDAAITTFQMSRSRKHY